MSPRSRYKADRGDSLNSEESFAGSDGSRQFVFPTVSHESKAELASNSDNKNSTAEQRGEAHDDNDASESDKFPAPETQAISISFGALARAQASLLDVNGKTRERSSAGAVTSHISSRSTNPDDYSTGTLKQEGARKDHRKPLRLSKHAPTEISSKKAVSRKRPVVPVPKRDIRDPRFENALGPINERKIKDNYAFLEQYRESEIKTLKAEVKMTKSGIEKERLKNEILRMESRKVAQDRKDAEQEVLRRHRKEEREKVALGKAPFYMKRAQVKKEALVERYKHMKGREVDKYIERRRKKRASRHKKLTPKERRADASLLAS